MVFDNVILLCMWNAVAAVCIAPLSFSYQVIFMYHAYLRGGAI